MFKRLFPAVALLAMSGSAAGQYRIGNYIYTCPVGVSWNDPRCARQEIVSQGSPNAASQRSSRWQDRWGAIYLDGSTGSIGSTALALNARDAEALALQRCQSDGSPNCKKALVFVNSCGVVAWPKAGGNVVVQAGPNLSEVLTAALQKCREQMPQCSIEAEICAVPQRVPQGN